MGKMWSMFIVQIENHIHHLTVLDYIGYLSYILKYYYWKCGL